MHQDPPLALAIGLHLSNPADESHSQALAIETHCRENGLRLLKVWRCRDIRHNEALETAIAMSREHEATLVVDHLYPLTRSRDCLQLLRESRITIMAMDLPEFSASDLDLLIALLDLEKRARSTRAKQSMSAAKARGVLLGNPELSKMHKRGQFAHLPGAVQAARKKKKVLADEFAESLRNTVEELIRSQKLCTLRELADALNSAQVTARRGGAWDSSGVHRLLKRLDVSLASRKEDDPEEYSDEWGSFA